MFEQIKARFAVWRNYRHTVRQLGHVDRKLLEDAGIEPHQIKARARMADASPSRWW